MKSKDMKQDLEALLYRSLDDDLAPRERRLLEEGLARSEDLRQERDRLIALRGAVSRGAVDSFGPFFVERLMRRLADTRERARAGQFWLGWVPALRRVAIAGAIATVALVAVNMAQTDRVSATAALGLPDYTVEQITKPAVESMLEELS